MLPLKIRELVNFEAILGHTITLNQECFDHAYTTALLVALKILHHVQLISCIIHQLCTSEFLSSKNYICLVARVVGFSASLIEAFRLHQ